MTPAKAQDAVESGDLDAFLRDTNLPGSRSLCIDGSDKSTSANQDLFSPAPADRTGLRSHLCHLTTMLKG